MVYSERNKYLFVAVPKTGSMTLTQGLTQYCRGTRIAPCHGWSAAKDYGDDVTRFLVIRHPVARMLSWWWHECANRPTGMQGWTFLRYMERVTEWRDSGTPDGDVPELYQTQAQWVDRVDPDIVLRYEELPVAFEGLPFETGSLVKYWNARRIHDSGIRTSTRDRLTQADWDAVMRYCPEDFERFSYVPAFRM